MTRGRFSRITKTITRVRSYLKDCDSLSLVLAFLWITMSPIEFFDGDHERAWYYLLLGMAWWYIVALEARLNRIRKIAKAGTTVTVVKIGPG